MRVGAPVTLDVIRRHLQGLHTVGTYVIDEQGLCTYAVFDADTSDGLSLLSDLQTRLNLCGDCFLLGGVSAWWSLVGLPLDSYRSGCRSLLAPAVVPNWG